MKQNSSQIPTHCSYDPTSEFKEKAPKVLSLRKARPKQYLQRFTYMVLNLIAEKRMPEEEENVELFYLQARIEDEAELGWINKYHSVYNESKTLLQVITGPGPLKPKWPLCRMFLSEFDFKLQLDCAYFGLHESGSVQSLLRKRSPYLTSHRRTRKKFVGVGYNDHGTMKNPATSGTPSWQEVSAANLPEKEPYSEGEARLLKGYFKYFRRHPVNRVQYE